MVELLRRQIPVAWLAWNGRFLGSYQPCSTSHGAWRLEQYQQTSNHEFCISVASKLISAKVYNQRRVLQRVAANRKRNFVFELNQLANLLSQCGTPDSIPSLRGYEGAASAKYFSLWAKFLPTDFPSEKRSTRPPLNPVNACISFGATLLYNETVSAIHARGLDPALGILHATENNRWSLALDLSLIHISEPTRPY